MTTKGHAVAFAQGILLQPVVNLFKTLEESCKESFAKGFWQARLLQTVQTLKGFVPKPQHLWGAKL